MKTKIFLCFCLLFVISLTQLPAQNGKNGNGTVVWLYSCDDFFQPIVNEDGVEIDYIVGSVIWHLVDHYKDGVCYESRGMAEDVDTYSTYTGEKFKILSCSNVWDGATNTTTRHFNLLGENGSHYVGSLIIDLNNYPVLIFTYKKLVCPGNNE